MYGGEVLTSCSNGSVDPEPEGIEKTISEVDEVTFNVTTASVGEANTNIVFTYARSKDGAKEKITIKDCDIEVLFNGEKQKTIKRLDFALNEYGDFMGDKATQYQCKISIEKKVAPGDIVKVVFNKKTGNLIGEGTESALINKLTVSLIDNDEQAGDGWYEELAEDVYRPLFPNTEEPEDSPTTGEITFAAFDGWGKYEIAEDKGETVTMSHSEKIAVDGCCGMNIKLGNNNTVECKVKNNGSETAYVKISVKNEEWSNNNGWKSGILSATVNGTQLNDIGYGALAKIEPNETASFVLTLDTTLPEADKFVVSLNSEATEEGEAEMPSTGNITISDASMYTK